MKKRILAAMMAATLALVSLVGCGAGATDASGDAVSGAKDSYTIGISQFAVHPSLDNCREGFLAGLAEAGIVEGDNLTIEYVNAQAEAGTAGLAASNFVTKKVDLICAIATPSAMTAYNAAMGANIPVIYTAVTDPVEAGLANADGSSVGEITGTSDALAVEAQLQMIREILPEATKIGIIYTTSEPNSISSIAKYEELAPKYGFEIVTTGVTAVSEVALAAANIMSRVDCLTNLTDNTVVSALQTVLAEANNAAIPVFGSEVEQVKSGCVASMGLEYFELGKQTGAMAAKVLKGEAKASEMAFEIIDEPSLFINTKAASNLGLSFPDNYTDDALEVFNDIIVE